MRRLAWMAGQAAAIIGLTVAMSFDPRLAPQIGRVFIVNVIVVAFATAVSTALWDWLRRPRAVRRLLADERKAKRKSERLIAARRRPGEAFEQRARRGVGQDVR